MEQAYRSLTLTVADQVATIVLDHSAQMRASGEPKFSSHWELANVLSDLRADNSVRVIVITGSEGVFHINHPHDANWRKEHVGDVSQRWMTFTGLVRWHQTMAEIEKPIVAKVNGDAIGMGQSLVFACDLIVAKEDAKFMDDHMTHPDDGPFSLVPGDGGASLIPLFMSPVKAKEYLMLSKSYTAADLARMGVINSAVPGDQLDATVDDLVRRLLERGAYALAWTKRVVNRRVVEQLNLTLDAGAAYEMVNFLHLEKAGWEEKKRLD